jgi:hypothetical protein
MMREIDFSSGPALYISVGLLCLAIVFTASFFLGAFNPKRRSRRSEEQTQRPRRKLKPVRAASRPVTPDEQVSIYTKCPKCSLGVKVPRGLLKTKIKCRDCDTEFTA